MEGDEKPEGEDKPEDGEKPEGEDKPEDEVIKLKTKCSIRSILFR